MRREHKSIHFKNSHFAFPNKGRVLHTQMQFLQNHLCTFHNYSACYYCCSRPDRYPRNEPKYIDDGSIYCIWVCAFSSILVTIIRVLQTWRQPGLKKVDQPHNKQLLLTSALSRLRSRVGRYTKREIK